MAHTDDREGSAFGDALIEALQEAVAHSRGADTGAQVRRVEFTARDVRLAAAPAYSPDEIRDIRHGLSMSQQVFAELLNASPSAVRAWEQGQRAPDGPTRRLLQVVHRFPAALAETVGGLPVAPPSTRAARTTPRA